MTPVRVDYAFSEDHMADFGTVNQKAQVLRDVARPGGSKGQGVPAAKNERPLQVGEDRTTSTGPFGYGKVQGNGGPLSVGETRPGGSTGQAASDRSVSMKKAKWIAD